MFMKYKHIIWDWNGTLLNDAKECAAVVDNIMRNHDLGGLSIERYRKETCFPVINFYKALGFDFEKLSFHDIAHEYMADYQERVKTSSLQPEAVECLEKLSEKGFTHSVLSAYEQSRLETAIEYFGLTSYFQKIIGLSDLFARSKVDNGVKWISELPYSREEVIFIGDTTHDHEVAEAMGIDCVLLTCGHQSPENFEETGRQTIDSLGEFCDWLSE